MLELINMIPPIVAVLMIGAGVGFAICIFIAIAWASSWSKSESYWREWTLFVLSVIVALIGVVSVVF